MILDFHGKGKDFQYVLRHLFLLWVTERNEFYNFRVLVKHYVNAFTTLENIY